MNVLCETTVQELLCHPNPALIDESITKLQNALLQLQTRRIELIPSNAKLADSNVDFAMFTKINCASADNTPQKATTHLLPLINDDFRSIRITDDESSETDEEEEIEKDEHSDVQHQFAHRLSRLEHICAKGRRRVAPMWARVVKYFFLTSVLWQLCNTLVLNFMVYQPNSDLSLSRQEIGVLIASFFQTVHLLVVVVVSIRLIRMIGHLDPHLTISFLIQSYLSTVLLFGGVYFLFFRFNPSAFHGIDHWAHTYGDLSDPIYHHGFLLFLRFVYFSSGVMTTCGFGDIVPSIWYSVFMVMLHQLISVAYNVVILGMGLAHFIRSTRIQTTTTRRIATPTMQSSPLFSPQRMKCVEPSTVPSSHLDHRKPIELIPMCHHHTQQHFSQQSSDEALNM
jgi:hypothetical protein